MGKVFSPYGIVVMGIAVAIGGYFYFGSGTDVPAYEAATVERGDVRHVVSVTGRLEPKDDVSLAFPRGGRIERVLVEEGQLVEAGETIAVLDSTVLKAQLDEAYARVLRERRTLDELSEGARVEDVAVSTVSVEKADAALAQARDTLRTTLARVYVLADSAVREDSDAVFENPTTNPKYGIRFRVGTTNYEIRALPETETMLAESRSDVGDRLTSLRELATTIDGDIEAQTTQAATHLLEIERFLSDVANTLNKYVADNSTEQTVYETFQTAVASARTSVSSARADLRSAQAAYDAAKSARALAQSELTRTDAPPRESTLAIQEAGVLAAERAAAVIERQIEETYLIAPVTGTVSSVDVAAGEVVAAGAQVAYVESIDSLELVAYTPEADIADIAVGDVASVVFDAFESTDVFEAVIMGIADNETMREGVPTYKTTLELGEIENNTFMLRPGMTADLDIITAEATNTLFVPTRTIVREGEDAYVRVWGGEAFERVPVTLGLRGSLGTTAIESGLAEGDEVVLYIDE